MKDRDCALTLVLIGPRHVGKTVYLSALANSPGIGVGDPASVKAVKMHWQALAKGENPAATAAILTNFLFSYSGTAHGEACNVDLRIPDYDGHFTEILSEYETGAKELADLRALIRQADGFIVFMPADEGDVPTMEKLRVEIGSFISVVREEYGDQSKISRPLVIAVNKWDLSPHFHTAGEDDAARAHIQSVGIYRDIYNKLASYFSDIVILPLSAYGRPVKPGELEPWRVEEPVAVIVEKCFAALKKEMGDLEAAGDWTALAHLLLRTRALWRRTPALDCGALLQKALAHCHARLVQNLALAGSGLEYEKRWREAPEKDFWASFTPGERAAIEDIRKDALAASGNDLAKKLRAAKNSADFESILQNAPESRFLKDLEPEQRASLFKLRATHERVEKRGKNFKKAWLALGLLVAALCGCGLYWYAGVTGEYARAADPGLGAAGQWRALAGFITKHESNPLAASLFAGKLREAATRREALVNDVIHDIEGRIPETEAIADACGRADSAKQLLDEASAGGLNAPPALLNRLELLAGRASAVCAARNRIEAARSSHELKEAAELLASLPRTEETARLRQLARDRALEVADAEAPEAARVARAREEYERLRRGPYLDDAEEFVRAHQDDANPQARQMAEDVRSGLGERYYRSLLDIVRSIETFADAELGPLREQAAKNGRYGLSDGQRKTLASELQKLALAQDKSEIGGLREKISTQNELEDMEERLRAIAAFPENTRLADNIFQYRRPDDLAEELAARARNLALYRKVLRDGLPLGNFEVSAAEGNALDLHGRRLGSGFTRNRELVARFPGGTGEISYKTSAVTDREENDGRLYILSFGPMLLRAAKGEVHLREENFGSADLGCSSPLDITVGDLFEIINAGSLRKPLAGSCHGITFIFHK